MILLDIKGLLLIMQAIEFSFFMLFFLKKNLCVSNTSELLFAKFLVLTVVLQNQVLFHILLFSYRLC